LKQIHYNSKKDDVSENHSVYHAVACIDRRRQW
jgi:hypothetical protein